jgi:hypothetical protein
VASINDCKLIKLPKIHNRAGNITPIQNIQNIPFEIKRVYYLYDVPAGSDRGGHAHKRLYQLILAASGSFDIIIDDGRENKVINMNQPYIGLVLVPGIWRELNNFSSGSICLVLASEFYSEEDYIRDYNAFISQVK